jgi:phosphatidylserine synthase
LAGALQYFGWPELFKVLLMYAYAARIPVALVMFFAMLGHWGTHYDYAGMQIPLNGLARYLWLAFFPQLVAWVGFTLTLGSVAGILAISMIRLSGLPVRNKLDRIDLNATS